MNTNLVNRKNDEEIINIMNSILSNGNMIVETYNEAILVKLMELRNTPIKVEKTLRNIDSDFREWNSENNQNYKKAVEFITSQKDYHNTFELFNDKIKIALRIASGLE